MFTSVCVFLVLFERTVYNSSNKCISYMKTVFSFSRDKTKRQTLIRNKKNNITNNMNSIVSSLFAFWIAGGDKNNLNESMTDSTKQQQQQQQLPLLKTQSIENTIGNLSNNQSSTSPRNNLQLVSSIDEVITTFDHHSTHQQVSSSSEMIPQWRTYKVDHSSINSMQPNRDITSFVLKKRKQFSKRNFSLLNRKEFGSLNPHHVNNYIVDDSSTMVRCMQSILLETQLIGNANYSSNLFTLKNQDNDSSNFHLYSSLPISAMNHACYYEVTLLETENNSNPTICLGFGKADNDLQNHIGWFCERVLHSIRTTKDYETHNETLRIELEVHKLRREIRLEFIGI